MGTPRSKKVSFDIASDVEGSKSNEKLLLYFFNGCAVYADGCAAYADRCCRRLKIYEKIVFFFTFSDGWIGVLLIVLNECYNYLISFSFLLIILSYLFCLLSIWFWIDQVESILSFSRFYSSNLLYLPLVKVFF